MKAKIRNALVTWNNPPTKDWDDLVAMLNPAYMVGQLERGEAGTLHWQFAVQWQNPRSFAAIKKDLPSLTLRRSELGRRSNLLPEGRHQGLRTLGVWHKAYGRLRQGTGRGLGDLVPARRRGQVQGNSRQNSNQAPGQFGAHSPPESQIHRPNRCARSLDLGRSRSRQEPLCPPCWEPRVTTLSSTISGGMAIRARRSSSWRTLTRKRSSSFTTTSRFGRTAGVHWRDQGGAVAPIHRWLVVTSNYSIMDILKDLEDRQLREAITVGSCGLRCSAATRSRTGTPTRPSPPRLWPPSLNE